MILNTMLVHINIQFYKLVHRKLVISYEDSSVNTLLVLGSFADELVLTECPSLGMTQRSPGYNDPTEPYLGTGRITWVSSYHTAILTNLAIRYRRVAVLNRGLIQTAYWELRLSDHRTYSIHTCADRRSGADCVSANCGGESVAAWRGWQVLHGCCWHYMAVLWGCRCRRYWVRAAGCGSVRYLEFTEVRSPWIQSLSTNSA